MANYLNFTINDLATYQWCVQKKDWKGGYFCQSEHEETYLVACVVFQMINFNVK